MARIRFPGQNLALGHGRWHVQLTEWSEFNGAVQSILDFPDYVYRGHRRNDWLLEPTLTRQLKNNPFPKNMVNKHLDEFLYAIRGRRGHHPPELKTNDDLWALGQHNGLYTPLLDWTTSPYVALFLHSQKLMMLVKQELALYG
jgi:hypothetical protein